MSNNPAKNDRSSEIKSSGVVPETVEQENAEVSEMASIPAVSEDSTLSDPLEASDAETEGSKTLVSRETHAPKSGAITDSDSETYEVGSLDDEHEAVEAFAESAKDESAEDGTVEDGTVEDGTVEDGAVEDESAEPQAQTTAESLGDSDFSELISEDAETSEIDHYLNHGLTEDEVDARIAAGAYNAPQEPLTRTVKEIVRDNVFTLFNFLNFGLAAVILFAATMDASHLKNLGFLGVVFTNLLVGIVQEVKAKETVDKLSLLVEPTALVLREGRVWKISVNDLVVDDIILLENGQQVSVDAVFIEGKGFEVDESQLTGEANSVVKAPGASVYSGSLVVAGKAKLRVTKVGADTYAARLAAEAKQEKVQRSELRHSLQKIIRIVSVIILPIGVALAFSKYHQATDALLDVVLVSSVAALVGMIPEGLILLTEVAFASGTINLARHKILTQTMPAIEMLARLDVLCLDKTGTITSGHMFVNGIRPLSDEYSEAELQKILGAIASATEATGGTQEAMEEAFQQSNDWKVQDVINFSSARKWSAVTFADHGSWFLGASEFILSEDLRRPYQELIHEESASGHRVLLLAQSKSGLESSENPTVPADIEAVCFVILIDEIREDAPRTLDYFREQGVTLKIISGDNPETVASIAKRAGFEHAEKWIDMSTVSPGSDLRQIATENNIFGRVNPYQKRALLRTLQAVGHTVGMTGDGVNDVPALREADCSIAMVSGSDAARRTADFVLLEDNLSALIPGVYEGRRIINNIERVATLFLVKTVYSSLLSFLYIFIPSPYPVFPIQMTLISSSTIGIPAFFLALKPNKNRVQGSFLHKVFSRALPAGLAAVAMIVFLDYFSQLLGVSNADTSTLATLGLGLIGFIILWKVSSPLTLLRTVLLASLIFGFIFALVIFPNLFYVQPLLGNVLFLAIPYLVLVGFTTMLFLRIGSPPPDSRLHQRVARRWGHPG